MSPAAHRTASALAEFPERYFAAWNNHTLDGVAGLFTPRLSWTDPSLPEELTDLDGAIGFLKASFQAFPDIHFEAVGAPLLDEAANRVAAQWRMTGTHTGDGFPPGAEATGRSFDVPGADVFTLDGQGRAHTVRAFYDAASLAIQLGLA